MSNTREIHSQDDPELINDPLQSISRGRFSSMQFNKPHTGIHHSIIGSDTPENSTLLDPMHLNTHNSTAPMMLPTETGEFDTFSGLGTNDDFREPSQFVIPIVQTKPKGFLSSRFLIRKSHAVLFLIFLLLGLVFYGAVYNESSSKWICDVLKSKALKMPYFIIFHNYSLSIGHRLALKKELGSLAQEAIDDKLNDIVKKVQAAHLKYQSSLNQVPMIYQNKRNGGFCLMKRVSPNFCNVTEGEKNKQIIISEAAGKELKYSAGPVSLSHCDQKFILSESFVSFEQLFLVTMKKMIHNATENHSSYFFHEWLQSILAKTMVDMASRLKLEFEARKDNETTTTNNYNIIAREIVQNRVEDSLKYEEKEESSVDKPITYNKGHMDILFQGLFDEIMLRYDADKEKFVDFALKSAGGKVLSVKQTENYFEKETSFNIWKPFLKLKKQPNSPEAAIQPGMEPGECWAFKGSQGVLVIKLASKIYPTGFTIEHIPASLSPSGVIDSAPKEFSVWGLSSRSDEEGKPIGLYSYNLKGYPLQYFPVQYGFNQTFRFVELRILSNHGNSEYTCLYRFRVHGRTAKRAFENKVVF